MKNFENDFNANNLTKDDLYAICNELKKMLLNVKTYLFEVGYSEQKIRDILFEKQIKVVKKTKKITVKSKEEYWNEVGNDILYSLYVFLTEEVGIKKESLDFSKK